MKICKDCGKEKKESDFYGVQGECKDCTKKRVRDYYLKNTEHYKKYEVERNKLPERKAKRSAYGAKYRLLYAYKKTARAKVAWAVKVGTLIKTPCEVCGSEKVEAHHKNYKKPLQVNWFCKKHHTEADKELKK